MVGYLGNPDRVCNSDAYCRTVWMDRCRQAAFACAIGFGVGNSLTCIIAAILYFLSGADNVVDVMITIGGGVLAFLIMLAATWTSNDNSLYSSGLALSIIFRSIPKPILTIGAGILGIIVGIMGIHDNLEKFLFVLTPLIVPVGGILYVDYFLLNNHKYKMAFIRQDTPPMFKPMILSVWAVATILTFMTTPGGEGGLGLFDFTTIPALDGIIFSTVLYYGASKTLDYYRQRKARNQERAA
ncbi:hypothetical protein [Desmospora activa]|uniref:hypothetical protein n=1 Tax=Desmospora activa TaxID=500615 RepID=UPI0011B2088E|nr:hypothetical protein [Desmospora activa]